MQKLYIISNESISVEGKKFFCDNIDLKSTPEGLNKKFQVHLFGRNSKKKKRAHEIRLKKINIFNNIFSYLSAVFSVCKNEEAKYLVISISPYTFTIVLFLKLLGKTPIVYLRSDGYREYSAIIGKIGYLIYHLMFNIVSIISNFISCRKYILKGKNGKVIYPSQIDSNWLKKPKISKIKNFKLLYVGRIKIEKGIFSLVDLIKNKRNIFLSMVGAEKDTSYNINQTNVKIRLIEKNKKKLISIYDAHNIFVLPSFTEGHPMVLLEALARRRPVIIFEEIKHVVDSKKGIFVSKRNFSSFLNTLNYIKKNYKTIQKDMKKNQLPTNKRFIEAFTQSINSFK